MKTLRKIRKNAKALSPVVASIILIAVTVAVSIAVAAWMGALTVGFMGSSSLTITNVDFDGTSASATDNNIILSIKNTGTKQVTISQIKINNVAVDMTNDVTGTTTYDAGDSATDLTIDMTGSPWVNGNPYKIDLYDSSGQAVGATQQNAPGA
jgi:flagellin-like protein